MPDGSASDVLSESDGQSRWPDHRIICTFAFKLPFPLRLPEGSTFMLVRTDEQYDDADDAAVFGEHPWVRIRLHNHRVDGLEVWPSESGSVLESFYQVRIDRPDELPAWGADEAYEQWVSLETPSGRLRGEAESDQAYHFHRCLTSLDVFIQSHLLALGDSQVHRISTPELSPMVFVGKYEVDGGAWELEIPMLTHPEALPVFTEHEVDGDPMQLLEAALQQLRANNPFVVPSFLSLRAENAHRVRGDFVDAVVSLATAMESRLFALWRCLLVDLGHRASDIESVVSSDAPFRTLLVTTLPALLGGRWDVTAVGTAVGDYWGKLYLLRNRVVHAGYRPTIVETDEARRAHDAMRLFVRERLWAKRSAYPRSVALYISPDVMRHYGWVDVAAERRTTALQQEEQPFFLPWDTVGRDAPSHPPKPLRRPPGRR